jgi:hypothetical protein
MDVRQLGGRPDENFYLALNRALQKREPALLAQLAG